MALLKHLNRLKYMDFMIKRKATGNLETFARKNSLCKRALAEVLHEMRELGFPIKFDRNKNTYYYSEEGKMVERLFVKEGKILSKEEAAKVGDINSLCFSETSIFQLCKK